MPADTMQGRLTPWRFPPHPPAQHPHNHRHHPAGLRWAASPTKLFFMCDGEDRSQKSFLLKEPGEQPHLPGIADVRLPFFPDGGECIVAVVRHFVEELGI